MSEPFDPYHKWLGIAAEEQPPNHYRLLGLNLFESDPDVIEHGSNRQMMHLRSFQTGPRMLECQQLLNEVAAARVVLLDVQKKGAYDQGLQASLAPVELPPPTTAVPLLPADTLPPRASPLSAAQTTASPEPSPERAAAPVVVAKGPRPRRKQAVAPGVLVAGGAIVLAVLLASGYGIRMALKPPPREVEQQSSAVPEIASPLTIESADPVGPPSDIPAADTPPSVPVGPAVVADDPTPSANVIHDLRREQLTDPVNLPSPSKPIAAAGSDVAAAGESTEMTEGNRSLGDLVNPPAVGKLPVPDDSALQAAREQIRQAFADELSQDHTPQEARLLAEKLIAQAAQPDTQPAARYVLQETAIDVASQGGAVDAASTALRALDAAFLSDLVRLKAGAAQQLARAAKKASEHKAAVELLEVVIEECLADDRFDLALPLMEAAVDAARKSKDSSAIARSQDQSREIKSLNARYKPIQAALDVLAGGADNPQASETVGKHLCLVKGKWDRGLPYLVQGKASDLRAVAQRDIQNPTLAETQAEIGNDWMNTATQLDRKMRLQALLRAEYWYRLAVVQQSGLRKLSLETRLQALAKEVGELAELPSGAVLVMTFEPSTLKRKGFVVDASQHGYVGAVKGAVVTAGIAGNALGFDGKDDYVEVASTPWLSAPSAFTLCAWVNVVAWKNPNKAMDYLISKDDWKSSGAHGYLLRYRQAGILNFTLADSGWHNSTSTRKASLGEWHHAAVTYDGHTSKLFMDGEREGNDIVTGAIEPSDVPLRIGQAAYDKARGIRGRIDEVAIFNRALSPDEVRTVFRIGQAGRPLIE